MPPKLRSTTASKVPEKKPRSPTFAELLAGESRIGRAQPNSRATATPKTVAARRRSNDWQASLEVKQNGERYEGLSGGTPNRVLQELKRGKHHPELTIDVHGLTSDQAVRMIDAVLHSALESDLRTLLIVYGRGLHSPEGPVLPGVVIDHLHRVRSESVLALCSAPAKWGGPGALLVRLRRM
jgi:DNA-nicking Smr family endonuclease